MKLNRVNELREKYLPYGWFHILFKSEDNVFFVEFQLGENEKRNFIKSEFSSALDELEINYSLYIQNYIPGYVR